MLGVKRINELDYIRCIAIFMVVMGHVLLFTLKIEHTALLGIIGICEMPLFFIVSGYLTYKEREESLKETMARLLKRSRALLVPLVVWSIVLNLCDEKITFSLSMVYRGGYWFFVALWWCDILNTFAVYISKKFKFGSGEGPIFSNVCKKRKQFLVTIERPSVPKPATSSVAHTGSPENNWL